MNVVIDRTSGQMPCNIRNNESNQTICLITPIFFPEPTKPTADGNLWAWFRSDIGITTRATTISDYMHGSYSLRITSSNTGSLWQDQSGNNHHFTNSYAFNRGPQATPYIQNSGLNGNPILFFKGPDNLGSWTYNDDTMLQTSQSTFTSPFTVYLLMKNMAWFSNAVVGLGNGHIYNGTAFSGSTFPYEVGVIEDAFISSPQLRLFGLNLNIDPIDGPVTAVGTPTLGFWHIITCIHQGSGSSIQIDSGSPVTGDVRLIDPNGFILGNAYNSIGSTQHNNSEMYVAGMIISSGSNDSTTQSIHRNWLNWYAGSNLF